jgi:hypothetical protein
MPISKESFWKFFFKAIFVPRPGVVARFILVLFMALNSFSQNVENKFIDALINNRDNIADYIDKGELSRSERLGIIYTDIKNKFLISYDIPDEIKAGFRMGKYSYSLQTLQLGDGFSVITLAIPASSYLQKFYFLNDKFVPPSKYFSRNWQTKQSKYFNFRLSEPKYFNDYCIKRLDDFVDLVADTLGFTGDERLMLELEKIDYILCTDENEVEKITGYKSKGQAILAYDEIVTAYPTHFHEVTHLLINYKLKQLGLYTLPFFMEGFAVAMGGRGGMAPEVITDIGHFLQKSGFMTYDSILTYNAFYNQDATMTYAVSGLYNAFLISQLGPESYLSFYKKLNGNIDYIKSIRSSDIKLPAQESFNNFLVQYNNREQILINKNNLIIPPEHMLDLGGAILSSGDFYKIFIIDKLLANPSENININAGYSKLLPSIFNISVDSSQIKSKYCITADSISVRIYNLYNDELIYNYNKSFSLANLEIPVYISDGYKYFTFLIQRSIFNNDFDNGFVIEGNRR